MNVREEYEKYCKDKLMEFELIKSCASYDESTLFCPAGMQKYKAIFPSKITGLTTANIQSCVRMNDFGEIGDSTHLLHFNMMGLFSFRDWTIRQAIDFWVEFIEDRLDLVIDNVTVHPDRYDAWARHYHQHAIPVGLDKECTWGDGDITGYCTEFYIDGVEIGNIVHPLESCIDAGFGLERLQQLVTPTVAKTKEESLISAILAILDSGYKPGPKLQGYVLRKLLRELNKLGGTMDHPAFLFEQKRCIEARERYHRLKDKNRDKSREWWYDTHGVDLSEVA